MHYFSGSPVVALGEASMLYSCQLGQRIGIVTINRRYIPWFHHQITKYGLERRVTGVHAMQFEPGQILKAYESDTLAKEVEELFDCVMPCAGAEAFIVCREDTAQSLGVPGVRILSTIERHNAYPSDPIQVRGGWALDVDDLWSMAGLRPQAVSLVETYDDYPVIVMMQLEDLGFCKKGEGPDFVRAHSFTTDGTFPHNTSGGQLSVGQAGAAGGFLGMTEAIRQVHELKKLVASKRRPLFPRQRGRARAI